MHHETGEAPLCGSIARGEEYTKPRIFEDADPKCTLYHQLLCIGVIVQSQYGYSIRFLQDNNVIHM